MRPLLAAPAARGFGLLGLTLALASGAGAQQASRTEPVTGIRDNGTGYHALVGARVVTGPGQVMENATIVIRDGLIRRVDRGGDAPAGSGHGSARPPTCRTTRTAAPRCARRASGRRSRFPGRGSSGGRLRW